MNLREYTQPDPWVQSMTDTCAEQGISVPDYLMMRYQYNNTDVLKKKGTDTTIPNSRGREILHSLYARGDLTPTQVKALAADFGVGSSIIDLSPSVIDAGLRNDYRTAGIPYPYN